MVLPGLVIVGAATSTVPFYCGLALLAIGSALVSPCLSALVSLYTPADRQGEVLAEDRRAFDLMFEYRASRSGISSMAAS